MKKALWGAVILIFLAIVAVWQGQQFNAERILAQSKLKERTFQGEVQQVEALDGTVHAYLMEEHSVPLVAVAFGFDRAGKAYEPKAGVALMAESVLLDGAGMYSRSELRNLMTEKGIRLEVSAEKDRLSFTYSYVKEFEKEALDVLKAVLYEPRLDAEDMALARQQLAVIRRQREENPQYQLNELMKKQFYGAHPYGNDDIPETAILEKVSVADVRAYLKDYMTRNRLSVGMAGDIDRAETEAFLAQVFAGLSVEGMERQLPVFEPEFAAEGVTMDAPHSAQSFVLFAAEGVKRLDDDFYPLYIADYILGGSGLASRLNVAAREKEGLTYGIYSTFSNSDAVDLWQIYFSATPENADKAIKVAQRVYADFYQNGVSVLELSQAKKGLLNSFNLRFAGLTDIAAMLEQMQAQHLGADFLKNRQSYVSAVTVEQVNSAIRRRMPQALTAAGGVRLFEAVGKK